MNVLLDALRCTRPTRGATGGAAGTAGAAGAAAGTASAAASGASVNSTMGGSSSMGDAGESVAGRSSAADGSGASASSGAGSAGSGGPGPPPMTSTAEMLAVSLLEGQAVEGRVTVSLFHTPALQGLLKRCAARLARCMPPCAAACLVWPALGRARPTPCSPARPSACCPPAGCNRATSAPRGTHTLLSLPTSQCAAAAGLRGDWRHAHEVLCV